MSLSYLVPDVNLTMFIVIDCHSVFSLVARVGDLGFSMAWDIEVIDTVNSRAIIIDSLSIKVCRNP